MRSEQWQGVSDMCVCVCVCVLVLSGALTDVIVHLHSLQSLTMRDNEQLTDDVLLAVSHSCTRLRSVCLSVCCTV